MVISWVYIPAAWQLFQMQKKMPPVGGLPFCKAYYYALPVLVMSVLMLYRIASYYFVFAASAVGFFLAQRRLTRTPPKEA